MKRNLNQIIDLAEKLSNKMQADLIDKILEMLGTTEHSNNCVSLIAEFGKKDIECPFCSAKSILGFVVKKGYTASGAQRYICKKCGHTFVPTTNTAFARSRKSADTWRKFIELTITGKGLHTCADECNIAYQTAFTWRHKILNVFVENQKPLQMSGVVEVDEMLIPISYKGNHIKGSFGARRKAMGVDTHMPRPAYERGSDNKSLSSKDKACVFCMIENNNKSVYAAVPGIGFMSHKMLDHTVGKHINKENTLMLADNYRITRNYFEENGYNHRILSSNTSDNSSEHKPEINGGLHLQHVNNMHHHIRRFLTGYCGVSSKYLENYIALYVWLKSIKAAKQRKGIDKASVACATTPGCYIARNAIESRPAVPMCA